MLVLTEKKQGVGWLYLNQQNSLNSLTAELAAAVVEAVAALEADPEVRVLVFSGQGRAFCAGGNLDSLNALTNEDEAVAFVTAAGKTSEALFNCRKPVIAMVNGVAAGAGFNLALACDLVFAAEGVKFIQSFSNIGLVPDCGGHYLLPRAIGNWRAKQAMFEAAPITAEEGKELGFVNAVYPAAELAEATEKYAVALAQPLYRVSWLLALTAKRVWLLLRKNANRSLRVNKNCGSLHILEQCIAVFFNER